MNIKEILNKLNGTFINEKDITINKFKINSKEINKNDCFIALESGVNYIDEATHNGASLIITDKKNNYSSPTILVKDSLKALGDIASLIREKYNTKVIAITGSVGKTTTRELIYKILSSKYKCLQNEKNYNNHIGVPLTMFNLKDEDFAIIEMGMNHLGEIKYLSDMVKPDIAVITNIGTSHIGNLGSKENILKAKLEITSGLKGKLFVNGDDNLLKNVSAIKSGFNKNNDLIAYDLKSNLNYSTFKIKNYEIKVNLPYHLISNVLLAINVGLYFNVDMVDIIQVLKEYKGFDMRMNIIHKESNTIINDCYNSSLESLKGVLKVISKEKGKKLLILGDINELGIYSEKIHNEIPKLLDKINDKDVFLVGPQMNKVIYPNSKHFNNYNEVINYLKTIKIKDTLILVKASRSLKLENIVNFLKNSYGF